LAGKVAQEFAAADAFLAVGIRIGNGNS